MTITERIREHLLQNCNCTTIAPDRDTLLKTQWCDLYELLRRNRMVTGFFRYGDIKVSNWTTTQGIVSIKTKINLYKKDGNLEHLLDIGNIAMVEFMHSNHELKNFNATDDMNHIKEFKNEKNRKVKR